MSAHTPGPWLAHRIDNQEWEIDAPNGDPSIGYSSWTGLASVYGSNEFRNQGGFVAEANARLIAAAPDLLAAAKGLAENFLRDELDDPELCFSDRHHAAVRSLFDAIAKAEGRE